MSLLRSIRAQLGLMSGGNESQNHFWDGSVANQLTLKRGVPDAPGATVMSVVDGNVAFPNTPGFSFRNKIINGGMDIWQRGTSQTGPGYGSDDRWLNNSIGSTKTNSRQVFSAGQTEVAGDPTYFSRTVVSSVAGAANLVNKEQRIENVRTLAGKKVTVSFYAKADAAKNIAIEVIQYFGSVSALGASMNTLVALTTSWKKYSVTFDVPSTAGKTIDDAVSWLGLVFWFDAGSNFSGRTSNLGQQSGTFDIAQVQLEEGSIATPFEQRPVGLELSLCQRYYQPLPLIGTSYWVGTGGSGSVWSFPISWTQMRVNPTVSGSTFSYTAASGGNVLVNGPSGGRVSFNASVSGGGTACTVTGGSLSAEL